MTAGLSEERLTQIRARAEAATPAPWHECDQCVTGPCYAIVSDNPHEAWEAVIGNARGAEWMRTDDLAFIAAARSDIPDLLDEIHRLREENEALRTDLQHEESKGWETWGKERARLDVEAERADRDALRQRIDNALALHQRRDRLSPRDLDGASCHGCCDHCCNAGDGEWAPHVAYPCETAAALTGQDPT